MEHEVVITGMGVACAIGTSLDEYAWALQQGENGIRPVTLFDPSGCAFRRMGEIRSLEFPHDGLDRASHLALYSAQLALRDSGLETRLPAYRDRTAVVLGSTCGGVTSHESISRAWQKQREINPQALDEVPFHTMAQHIADQYSLQGPALTVTIACASGSAAVGHGADLIRSGLADVVLAGGSDTVSLFTFSGFSSLRAMTTDEIRPFDRQRRGIALGEGSAVLVLEPFAQARRRGAQLYARVLGHGLCNDAFHSASPDLKGGGMARSIRRALAMAELAPSDIQYVNAHGTGTRHNDIMESAALHQVFAADAARIPVSATKSMIGHTLGAAGAVEMVASVLAMTRGFIPPTINSVEPDPALDLDIVPNQARESRLERVLCCNAGFGGNNAAVVLGAA